MNSDTQTLEPSGSTASSTSNGRPAPESRRSVTAAPRKPRTRTFVLALLGLAVAAWAIRFAIHAYRYESTDDAYVAGHLHRISPQVSGQIKEVRVNDNQVVQAGDVLATIDAQQFQIAVEKAQAALAQSQAQEAQANASVEEAEAQYTLAQARLQQSESQLKQVNAQAELARVTLKRTNDLYADNKGAATQADLDNAQSSFDSAQAGTSAAQSNIAAAKAAVTSAAATRDAARAQAKAAHAAIASNEAAVRDAEIQLNYTTITAPVAGRVGNKAVEPGDRVQAGQSIFALAESQMWVIANFKETQLAHMHAGQPVELTIDALPGESVSGHIESLAPASGAQFALLPPDNATGNFNKVVQRVPVKIVLEPETIDRLGSRLRLGLSVIPEVRVR